ncbi:MAG: heavy metal-binding domain-containing protein [Clostridia bacterium]|nr:heavy metal-binding domain-containing protein [Clostridia bacterium]
MIITTTEQIEGRKLQIIGLVKGSTVQSKHLGSDIGASLKNLVGGELKGYTDMLDKARQIATGRLIDDAASQGADAVVGVRYTTSAITQGAAEVMAYGTAVKFID